MSIKKEDLLNDIQEKIDICNKHISTNPYEPAQRRVGYVLNNKCKTSDIPFYLNAIYNQQQLKLNTDISERKKHLYSVEETFALNEVTPSDIYLSITDQITTTKEQLVKTQTKGGFLGLNKQTNEQWVDVISSVASVNDSEGNLIYQNKQRWQEKTSNNIILHFDTYQEALRQYNVRKTKEYKNKTSDYENISPTLRKCHYHTYEIGGQAEIQDSIIAKINRIIDEENKKNSLYNKDTDLYNWEFYSWEFYIDGKLNSTYYPSDIEEKEYEKEEVRGNVNNYIRDQIYISISDILNKMNQTKSDTSGMDKILNQNKKIHQLIDNFDKKYFDPYYEAYSNYSKKYGYNKEVTDKKKKAFDQVKSLLDKMFKVILQYDSQISLNSTLADFIVKYNNFNKNYSQNQIRPTIVASKDTQSSKKLTELMKQKQKILNSGNAKLKEYYDKQEAQYQDDITNHILEMQKNMEEINRKEKELTSFLDSQNLRYNGLQTAFKEQLQFILSENQKKAIQLDAQYKQNLFQQSDIQLKIIVKFIPSQIPSFFYSEVIDKSFIYEDLQNKMKEIINGQNKKKQDKTYSIEQYNQIVQDLNETKQQLDKQETYLRALENSYNSNLMQLKMLTDSEPTDFSDKWAYVRYQSQKGNLENELNILEEEIKEANSRYETLKYTYNDLSQRVHYFETEIEKPDIQEVIRKQSVYDEKQQLVDQLNILNLQIQETEAIRKNQTTLNQAIITTNQNYVLKRNECTEYFNDKRDLQNLQKYGGDPKDIEDLKDKITLWERQNHNKLVQLNQYEIDLQKQKNDYLNNINFLKSTQDLKTRRDAVQEQLTKLDQKIKQLEAPQIQQIVGINEDGIAQEQGYNFSPNGLYQNLYIDVQTDNEWLNLRSELQNLYAYYNMNLDDQIEEEQEEEKKWGVFGGGGEVVSQIIETINKTDENKCNWFIPMDYEIFGAGFSLPLKLTTKVYTTDKDGNKIPVIDENGQATGEFQTERRQMAVQNGYGYIFTGQYITLMYTGLPGPPSISVFISGVGLEYGALLAGGYVAITPYNFYLMKKYPYQNTDPNGQFYWLQTGVVSDAIQTIQGKLPIEVTFKIYKKIPLNCGYPKKCGVLTEEEYAIRGECGLRKFFEGTHDITTDFNQDSFDITAYIEHAQDELESGMDYLVGKVKDKIKESTSNMLQTIHNKVKVVDNLVQKGYQLYRKNAGEVGERAAKFMQAKRNIAQWGNTSYSLVCNTWNIPDTMSDISTTKEQVSKTTREIIDKMGSELIDLIPPECQDTICQTMRESQQDSIEKLGLSVNEATKVNVNTLNSFIQKSISNTYEDLKDKTGKIIDGIGNVGSFIGEAFNNFIDQFDFWSLTQYCPRRLSDIAKDINPLTAPSSLLEDGNVLIPEPMNVFTQMGNVIGQEIIGNVMGALNNCITRSITNHNIHYSNLFPEDTRKYLEAANSVGDIANMAKGIGGYNMSLNNLFHEANRSAIIDNFIGFNTDSISLGYVTDFANVRGISDIIDTDDLLDKYSDISIFKNAIGQAVSNNNDIIDKIKKGEVLSMNDQYKQLVDNNLNGKTQEWANRISDKTNAITSIGQNAKGLLNTDFSNAWKNPYTVMRKVGNITNTMNNMFMKEQARRNKQNKQLNEAFGNSDQLRQMKAYLFQRWDYLTELTKQDYSEQKYRAEDLLGKNV